MWWATEAEDAIIRGIIIIMIVMCLSLFFRWEYGFYMQEKKDENGWQNRLKEDTFFLCRETKNIPSLLRESFDLQRIKIKNDFIISIFIIIIHNHIESISSIQVSMINIRKKREKMIIIFIMISLSLRLRWFWTISWWTHISCPSSR